MARRAQGDDAPKAPRPAGKVVKPRFGAPLSAAAAPLGLDAPDAAKIAEFSLEQVLAAKEAKHS